MRDSSPKVVAVQVKVSPLQTLKLEVQGVIHKANLDSTMTMSNMCAQNINRLMFTAAEYH